MATDLWLTNSRTRKKERFAPIDPGNVRVYACGPTVYDRAHLGNARPAIVFDVLVRVLQHLYGTDAVTYVRNFTDVDDKINAKAAQTGRAISDITDETIGWYHADMDALGVARPDHEPRATAYIPQMVAMIEALIDKGHAYAAEGHVLFRVDSWRDGYGKLSGRSLDDMIAGARVEVAPYKENPMDFVLWKPSDDKTPGWDSPWGRGRPGWHIECSAMAKELLGETFDIHAGGNDLMFPHHENEIAQSCCANGTERMANYWLHNEMLQVEGKKMSKSLGNFFTVRDLLDKGVPGEVIRFVMLSTHYRKPMDWTEEKAREAEKWLRKASETLTSFSYLDDWEADANCVDAQAIDALAQDLNASLALTRLRALESQISTRDQSLSMEHRTQEATAKSLIATAECLLGIDLRGYMRRYLASPQFMSGEERKELSGAFDRGWPKVALEVKLLSLREKAMQNRDFSEVDRLKAALVEAGVEVRMSKAGVELIPGPDFDPAKLECL